MRPGVALPVADGCKQAKIVRQEAISIDAAYEKKTKQAQVAQKMCVARRSSRLLQSLTADLSAVLRRTRRTPRA